LCDASEALICSFRSIDHLVIQISERNIDTLEKIRN